MVNVRLKICCILCIVMFFVVSYVPVFALTESEVQQKVDSEGREAVTGSVFIWFLCAIAFLKVSQKIDSFMSSLGINVGHTGGSMLAEAMLAIRGIGAARNYTKNHGSSHRSDSYSEGSHFMSRGLAGAVGRKFTNGVMKSVTENKNGGLSSAAYNSSVSRGGNLANRVIGNVAKGDINTTGTISGTKAADALMSYLGYTALGNSADNIPTFSNVEIGGGRITATETTIENPNGISIGMYHTDQYEAPTGDYSTITAADGSTWYKQYAVDTVEKIPYQESDGSISYNEAIIKRLPKAPPRKDKV